jgi:mannose-1-phosphate guanylyltransferase/mannose-6-phosphate isomerase
MLRETADRLDGVLPPGNRFVITNASLVDAVVAECPEIPRANVIGEPEGRNTAPAIGLMAGLLVARDPEAVLLVLPADHAIGHVDAFRASLEDALQVAAESSVIALFGVPPNRPETGYGYIERGEPIDASIEAYEVERFREKPSPAEARELWQDGRHYWNSGLFCGQGSVFLTEYGAHLPLMRRSIDAAVPAWEADAHGALQRYYASVEATSIDVGVMQQSDRAVVLPAGGWGWDDVGSWEALARWLPATSDGNVTKGTVALEGCRNVIAYAQSGRIAALGARDCVIVRTDTETMVAGRDALDRLRDFARAMAARTEGGAP